MNKFTLIAIVCSIFFFKESSFAQEILLRSPPGDNITIIDERIPGVEGSQYLSEEWTKGHITLKDETTIDTINLRLNVYRQQMHYFHNGVEYSIGSPENIKEITMGNRKFIYCPYKDENEITHGYFEVLVEGDIKLLVLFHVTRIPANYNVVLDCGNQNDQLKLAERYFISKDNAIIEVDKKGKSLFSYIGEKGELLRKKIKEERLSFKAKEDLVEIVTHVNTLI